MLKIVNKLMTLLLVLISSTLTLYGGYLQLNNNDVLALKVDRLQNYVQTIIICNSIATPLKILIYVLYKCKCKR